MSMTPAPVDRDDFRNAMGCFATGVAIMTTRLEDVDHVMTVNSLTSVSLDPMLVLVCIERSSRMHELVLRAGVWGMSVLAADQRAISNLFATRGRPGLGQLDRLTFTRGEVTGVAFIDGALAHLECRTTDAHSAGDHTIVVGEAQSVIVSNPDTQALLFHRGRYGITG